MLQASLWARASGQDRKRVKCAQCDPGSWFEAWRRRQTHVAAEAEAFLFAPGLSELQGAESLPGKRVRGPGCPSTELELPIGLRLPRVIQKLSQSLGLFFLVAPWLLRRSWFATWKALPVAPPWKLPDLFSQGPVLHHRLEFFHLTA